MVPKKSGEDILYTWDSELLYDSFEEAKKTCCEMCELYRPPCTTYHVIQLEEEKDNYASGQAQCILYQGKPEIQDCSSSGCPVTNGANGLSSRTSLSANYVGTMDGKEPKCGYAALPEERDYSFLGYEGNNGFAFKGFKSRGGLHKVAKNVRSIKSCFQKCVDDDDSECDSFTYDTKKKRCRMNKGGYIFVSGEDKELLSEFCASSDRYVSGFIVDEYD